MENYSEVYQQVQSLAAEGLSLVAVYDRQIGEHEAKTSIGAWKQFQTRIADVKEVWNKMVDNDSTGIAAVCGTISGNLEIIDIDSKHQPGIEAKVLTDIKDFYPDLFERLRIDETPSGGYHIAYKLPFNPEGSKKLAGRKATPEELETKPNQKIYHYIETRGESALCTMPPTIGYKIIKSNLIPVISARERAGLIAICESHNLNIVYDKPYTPSKTESSFYDENPFDDFNNRCDAVKLAEEEGWSIGKHNSRFIWFTRPGGYKKVYSS